MLRLSVHRFAISISSTLAFLPVALEGDEYGNFVPDVLKPLGVIRSRLGEHLAIGDVDDAAGVLIRGHPVSNLHQRELEDPQIDHVARVLADLDPIAHFEGFAPEDECPAREVHDRVAQRNRESDREQP